VTKAQEHNTKQSVGEQRTDLEATALGGGDEYSRRLKVTPEMLQRGTEILAAWMAENAEFLELGALGHVGDLLARIWPIFPNSCNSSLETESRD
jgi:hypothetical protein